MGKLKILFKFPTKGRPTKFVEAMNSIYDNIYDKENFFILITCADYDETMNNKEMISAVRSYKNTEIIFGENTGKIQAVNRNLDIATKYIDFDIIICMSDDMRFSFYGFDEIIREQFLVDLDILLHIPDQDAKSALATMYIAGRKYFDRFGYIYHPSYKSLWCDNEVQDVAKMMGKYRYLNMPGVISHLNPAYGHSERDELFNIDQQYWGVDEKNYYERKQLFFYVREEDIVNKSV